MILKISEEFSELPGGRYRYQGSNSAEEFRDELLRVKYDLCLINNEKLVIDFDDGYGYGSGFLEESFGGMVRLGYDSCELLNNLVFKSDDDVELPDKVKLYIERANKNKKYIK